MTTTSQVDHPITLEPAGERVRVRFAGEVVADTRDALVMRETVYPPIFYIPRGDVRMEMLERTDHTTRCPHKGIASHYSIRHGAEAAENSVWSYEDPLEKVSEIAGRLAFYPRHVEFETGG